VVKQQVLVPMRCVGKPVWFRGYRLRQRNIRSLVRISPRCKVHRTLNVATLIFVTIFILFLCVPKTYSDINLTFFNIYVYTQVKKNPQSRRFLVGQNRQKFWRALLVFNQGDQTGRLFAHCVIVFFG
jgi:hypothetical protein